MFSEIQFDEFYKMANLINNDKISDYENIRFSNLSKRVYCSGSVFKGFTRFFIITIIKGEDDWFFVCLESLSKYYSNQRFYKCDQIYGFEDLLSSNLHNYLIS